MKTFLFVTNDAWFFASHRLPIAKRLVELGHHVVVVARSDEKVKLIEAAGCQFIHWCLDPRGTNVARELFSLYSLAIIIGRIRPDIIHLVTIKAVLYGGLIARLLRIRKVVCAVSGLGAILEDSAAHRTKALKLYRLAVSHDRCTLVFQNPDNQKRLSKLLDIPIDKSTLIMGSGVDLDLYEHKPEPKGKVIVTMAARLLRDKGVSEYLEAAQILAKRGVEVSIQLAGDDAGSGNPSSYSPSELSSITQSNYVHYRGFVEDIATLFSETNVVVLPSYHEGLPKVLQEAAACGRAVVTTDAPGCVCAVVPDVTALVVPVKNSLSLANAIEYLANHAPIRKAMGNAARQLAERQFSIDRIVDAHMSVYEVDVRLYAGLISVGEKNDSLTEVLKYSVEEVREMAD